MKKSFLLTLLLSLPAIIYAQQPIFKWAGGLGGDQQDRGHAITVDDSGNVYTTGRFQDTADFDPGAGTVNLITNNQDDVFVTKMDSSGNLIWAKQLGGPNYQTSYAVEVDAAGAVYITGEFDDTADFDPGPGTYNLVSYGGRDIFICKLSAAGNFVWANQIGHSSSLNEESVADLVLDATANIYVTGYFYDNIDFDPGVGTNFINTIGTGTDQFILKLDSAGNFVYVKQFGGTGTALVESIAIDAAGNLYCTGVFSNTIDFDPGVGVSNLSAPMGVQIYAFKLSAAGTLAWAKQFGEPVGGNIQGGTGIAVDAAGNVYITGLFDGPGDYDPGPGTFTLTPAGLDDVFIAKFDPAGNFTWAKRIGSTGHDVGRSIDVDASGNVYVTGVVTDTVDFDPGAGTQLLQSTGEKAFTLKLNTGGNFVWATNLNSGEGYSVIVDQAMNVYSTGSFSGVNDFDPGAGVYNLTGILDVYVQKLSQPTVSVSSIKLDEPVITLYPNPNNGHFNIKSTLQLENASIKVQSINGQTVVAQSGLNGRQLSFDLPDLVSGVYFVEINTASSRSVFKLVKK
ncbi:MAG TPA: SBBP repeat-containing protein [Flavipsychrobacter sp.]|nr:SBBP repeat-containing protein [Flavipsychrobacter sp.]